MIVIICDGASKGNPGPSSIGVVIWARYKGKNQQMVEPTHKIQKDIGIATNMQAEWTALIEALNWVKNNNLSYEEVYIYSDSQVIVKQANKEWRAKHNKIIRLYEDYNFLIGFIRVTVKVTISWLPRQLIYLADKEAQKGGINAC